MIAADTHPTNTTNGHSSPSDDQHLLLDRARQGWIRRLADRSRNNNLLYFRDLRTGTLDLTNSQSAALDRLLGGAAVRIDELLPDTDESKPRRRSSRGSDITIQGGQVDGGLVA